MKLLLAEDERELSNALCAILRHNNYSVDAVYDGEDAYLYGKTGDYDGIILDVMMPKQNGIEVLKALRAEGISSPVLILTARSETEDKIEGLDAGADDYLTKPFSMGELLARIRAMTRRKAEYLPDLLKAGNVTLSRDSFELTGPKGSVRLSSKEFHLLEMLIVNRGRLISTERIMEKIWGYDSQAEISVVWVNISYLRRKLRQIGADIEIRASRGIGYSLEEKTS